MRKHIFNIIAIFTVPFLLISGLNNAKAELTLDKVDASNFHEKAVIQALNKITAKTSELETKIGEPLQFGKLTILAHQCWQAPLDQRPESKILLEIFDHSIEEELTMKNRVFYGWMLASSPSISDLEHPIYDITAISCKTDPIQNET